MNDPSRARFPPARRHLRAAYWLLACWLLAGLSAAPNAAAQTVTPVTVLQTPPLNFGSLADLTDASASPWSATVVLLDAREPSVPVGVRVRIEGNNFAAETRDVLRGPLLTLSPGAPTVLTAVDLAAYLQPDNLSVRGVDPRAFFASGAVLPEGAYTLCVEVIAVQRASGQALGRSCTPVLAQAYDPPEVVTPSPGTTVLPTEPQFVTIAWNHRGPVPPGVSYEVAVYEVDPARAVLSVDDVVRLTAPLIQAVVPAQLQFNIDPAAPALTPGRRYVTRVRMFDPLGAVAIRNRGYSRPVSWVYGAAAATGDCPPPANVRPGHVGQTDATLTWAPPAPTAPAYRGYTLALETPAASTALTVSLDARADQHYLPLLAREAPYTYTLTAQCATGGSALPVTGAFRTLPTVADNPNAGCDPSPTPVDTDADAASLTAGAVVDYRGMGLTLTQLTGGTGTATVSGEGTLNIPWLEQGIIHVDFTDLRVDASAGVTGGRLSPKRASTTRFNPANYAAVLGTGNCGTEDAAATLDENGFTPGGIHYVTGTTRDVRGFDQTGAYVGPGATAPPGNVDQFGFNQAGLFVLSDGSTREYDDDGCDVEGFTEEGWPCGTTGANLDQVGRDYATQFGPGLVEEGLRATAAYVINTSDLPAWAKAGIFKALDPDSEELLRTAVTAAFAFEQAHLADSTALVRGVLADLTEPDRLASVLGVGRDFLFGEGDSLLLEGLSALYPDGFPVALPAAGRDADIVALEAELRRRYTADTTLARQLRPRAQVMAGFSGQAGQDYLQTLVKSVVEHLDGNDLKDFTAAVAATVSRSNADALRDYAARLIRREAIRQSRLALGALRSTGSIDDIPAVDDRWHSPRTTLPPPDYEQAWANAGDGDGLWMPGRPPAPPTFGALLPTPSRHPLFGYQLPLRITKRGDDGRDYVVIVDSLTLPVGTGAAPALDAYAILPVPGQPGKAFVFSATGIPVGPGGLAGGTATLKLASRASFGLGAIGTLSLPHDDPNAVNAVEIDCEGFVSFRLSGDLAVCREHAIPVNVNGDRFEPTTGAEELTLGIRATGTEWPNFTFAVENPKGTPFIAPDLEEVVLDFESLVIDYSETKNAAGFVLPEGYRAQDERWRGLYAAKLAAHFTGPIEDGGRPVGFGVDTLIIDHQGLTFSATATDLVDLGEGNAGSWDASLDLIRVDVLRNDLTGLALAGTVKLPVDDERVLGLSGGYEIDNGRKAFGFGVSLPPGGALDWDVWAGELSLQPNSEIAFAKTADGYMGTATLYGVLDLGTAATAFDIDDISIRGFELYTEAPYFGLARGGGLSVDLANASRSVGGFGLELERLGFRKSESSAWNLGLDVSGRIALMDDFAGFSVGGNLGILGYVDQSSGSFDFRKLKVDEIDLDLDIPGVEIRGGIAWRDEDDPDPTYGAGFSGEVQARFRGVGAGIKAAATFGSVNGYRYWLVDAAYLPPAPIPLIAPLGANAIGGGASFHMEPKSTPGSPAEIDFGAKGPVTFGKSFTGITYQPNKDAKLGLRLALGTELMTSASALNGDLVFGMTFDDRYRVRTAGFKGSVRMMQEPAAPGSRPTGPASVRADADITYNHTGGPGKTPQLHAALRTYVNAPTGAAIVKGAGNDEGLVGDLTLHVDRDSFYVWIGEPTAPISVRILDMATVSTYYDIGSKLPQMAELPGKKKGDPFDFQSVLGIKTLELKPDASGFAHGLDWRIYKDKRLSPFRIKFAAQAGYNLTVSDGFECGTKRPGIGGWYAVGNAYAGLGGKFYVTAPGWACWSCPADFELFGLEAIVVGHVEAPNPTFVTGAAKFTGSVLGGLWKPSWSGRVSFGNRCGSGFAAPDDDSEFGLPKELILETRPQVHGEEVSVAALPSALFAIAEGKDILLRSDVAFEQKRIRDNIGRLVYETLPVVDVPTLKLVTSISVTNEAGTVVGGGRFQDAHPETPWRWYDPGSLDQWVEGERYLVTVTAALHHGEIQTFDSYITKNTLNQNGWPVRMVRLDTDVPPTMTVAPASLGVYEEKGHRYEQVDTFSFVAGSRPRLEFVREMAPAHEEEEVGVDVVPYVRMRYDAASVNYAYPTFKWTGKTRVELDTIMLVHAATGQVIAADVTADSVHRPARNLRPKQWLDPETDYDLVAIGRLMRYEALRADGTGDAYVPFTINGEPVFDTVVHRFMTENAPRELFAENIRVSYPLPDQHNFYLHQTDEDCFVSLSRPQAFLWKETAFGLTPKQGVKFEAVYFDDYSGEEVHRDAVRAVVTDEPTGNTVVTWPRPPATLQPGYVYRVELVVSEEAPAGTADAAAALEAARNPFEIPLVSTARAAGPVRGTIYSNRFRVSRYRTVGDKLAVLAQAVPERIPLRGVLTPDYPAGYTDDENFVWPLAGAACRNRPHEVSVKRWIDRPETRDLGALYARRSTSLVEGFDVYEVEGYEADVVPDRNASRRDLAFGFGRVELPPLLSGTATSPQADVLAELTSGQRGSYFNSVIDQRTLPMVYAGVRDINAVRTFPWPERAIVQRAPALRLAPGQGPDPDADGTFAGPEYVLVVVQGPPSGGFGPLTPPGPRDVTAGRYPGGSGVKPTGASTGGVTAVYTNVQVEGPPGGGFGISTAGCIPWAGYEAQARARTSTRNPGATLEPIDLGTVAVISGAPADERAFYLLRELSADRCFGHDDGHNCGFKVGSGIRPGAGAGRNTSNSGNSNCGAIVGAVVNIGGEFGGSVSGGLVEAANNCLGAGLGNQIDNAIGPGVNVGIGGANMVQPRLLPGTRPLLAQPSRIERIDVGIDYALPTPAGTTAYSARKTIRLE